MLIGLFILAAAGALGYSLLTMLNRFINKSIQKRKDKKKKAGDHLKYIQDFNKEYYNDEVH